MAARVMRFRRENKFVKYGIYYKIIMIMIIILCVYVKEDLIKT